MQIKWEIMSTMCCLVTHKLKVTLSMPYKKAKKFYETSQKFQKSWSINFHGQNGQKDDELLQFVKCCIHLDVIGKDKISTPKGYTKEK